MSMDVNAGAEVGEATTPGEIITAPMSDLQRDWWDRLARFPNPDLVMSRGWWIDGPVAEPVLAEAVRRLVVRHEALRTGLTAAGGDHRQVIYPEVRPGTLQTCDLSGEPPQERDRAVAALLAAEGDHPFDLEKDSLFRVRLLKYAPEQSLLVLTLHHTIADGAAYKVIYDELSTLYEQVASGASEPALPVVDQLRDWTARERELTAGPTGRRQLEYWHQTLRDVRPLHVPYDRAPADPLHFVHAERTFQMPAETAKALTAGALKWRATTFIICLAAFYRTLSEAIGRTDVAAVTLAHRREDPAARGVAGCVMNGLVVPVDLDGLADGRELIAAVRSAVLGAYAHKDVSSALVWEACGLPPGSVDALFIYDKVEPGEVTFAGMPVRRCRRDRSYERYGPAWENLKLRTADAGAVINCCLEYNAKLYDTATVDQLIDRFTAILGRIVGASA